MWGLSPDHLTVGAPGTLVVPAQAFRLAVLTVAGLLAPHGLYRACPVGFGGYPSCLGSIKCHALSSINLRLWLHVGPPTPGTVDRSLGGTGKVPHQIHAA